MRGYGTYITLLYPSINYLGFKENGVIEVQELVSFDDKDDKDDKRQKWDKSETDENGYFNLTNRKYGKLLTAKERNKWTLEGKLVYPTHAIITRS